MKLSFNAFCSNLIFHPCKAETKRDRIIATIASLVCAVLFVGLCHLVCACRQFYIKKKNKSCPDEQKIVNVATPILTPNTEIDKPVLATNTEVATPIPTPGPEVAEPRGSGAQIVNPIQTSQYVSTTTQEPVEGTVSTITQEPVEVVIGDKSPPNIGTASTPKPKIELSLKDQCKTRKTWENVINGKSAPLLQIDVCSQTEIPNSRTMCGYHALKNAFVGLGISKGIFKPEDFESETTYHELLEVFNKIIPKKEFDVGEEDIEHILNQFPCDKIYKDVRLFEPARAVLEQYQDSIVVTSYRAKNNIFKGLLGTIIYPRHMFGDLISLIELDKKLRLDIPFCHAFVLAHPVYSWGHWISLILERDEKGDLTWYGMDSWNNQEHVLRDAADAFSQLLELISNHDGRLCFFKQWYHLIVHSCKDFSSGFPDPAEVHEEQLKDLSAAMNFIQYLKWLDEPNLYTKELNEIENLAKELSEKGFSEHPIVKNALDKFSHKEA